ncbi:MAG: AAA family ATPase [Saprospiraceae bacterium]|nr:AAA family ATPase [Saprospiraceae bacterium]
MNLYIERKITDEVLEGLSFFPVVGILGPRQAGKLTFIKNLKKSNLVNLDLENANDRAKISFPFVFFEQNTQSIVCLDEVQFEKDIFQSIKSIVDKDKRPGRFIILGSASPQLLNQSN